MADHSSTQRCSSTAKLYKHAPPALNEKLQRYREDPKAFLELQKRVRQHKTASRPGTPKSPHGMLADTSEVGKPSSCISTPAAHAVSQQQSPRNFIEENAAVVTPWPCTGPLSSTAIATAQRSCAVWDDPTNNADSSSSSPSTSPRPASASDKRQQPPGLLLDQLSNSGNPFAAPQLQEQPWNSPQPTATSFTTASTASAAKTASSISRMHSAVSRVHSSSHIAVSKASSTSTSMSRSASQKNISDNEGGTSSCLEHLGARMTAKKEAAAARAAGAADRRTALAEAEQQRRHELSTRSARLEAARIAALQVEAAAAARLEQQELWSGVVVATAVVTELATSLARRRRQGAAAAVIADAYKRCLIRRRHKEFIRLIVRVHRAIKPNLPRLLEAAHKRCADRILLFLQRNTSSSIVLHAAHRFRHSVTVIQSHWRQVRLVRAAQEHLLAAAMRHLEQQLVARNTSAATQAALAAELQSNMQQHGRVRSSRAHGTWASGSGGRGMSSSGERSTSSSGNRGQSNGVGQLADAAMADVRPRSGSDRSSSSGGGQQQQQLAVPIVPFVRHGNTLFLPQDFFIDEPRPEGSEPAATAAGQYTASSSANSSTPVSPDTTTAAAAAALRGPLSPRGGYMTGQLTSSPLAARSPRSRHRDLAPVLLPGIHQQQIGAALSLNRCRSPRPHSPGRAGNSSNRAARSPAGSSGGGAAAGGCGSSIGWHPDVVDLEIEARLKDLYSPLPSDIRRQVVRSHLAGVRRVLIADREAHAAAMKHYHKKLELEKLKQQLLKEAGLDAAISLQAPKPPRMKVLVSRDKLKQLIVEGMDLLQQQFIAARTAGDDAAGPSTEETNGPSVRRND